MNMFSAEDQSWRICPYPPPHRFAFSIVQDADSGYSERLAPLFDCFDELGFKITVTVFPFWASWARRGHIWDDWRRNDPYFAPVAVPLEDDKEREFYQRLAAAGHEIAMHTPSETSSSRKELIEAFEFFKSVFGHYPKTYVEHSPDNNLDAQRQFGADPQSVYYNTDLLNDYDCWVWVSDPECGWAPKSERDYNLLTYDGAPFVRRALELFGIQRAFARNGRGKADGDAFLEQYSRDAIDALEREGGLALLYTHLNYGWLDPDSRRMREAIRERLRYLASKAGWFVPARTILDRLDAISQVKLISNDRWLKLINGGSCDVQSLVLNAPEGQALQDADDLFEADGDGRIVVARLAAGETKSFRIKTSGHPTLQPPRSSPA